VVVLVGPRQCGKTTLARQLVSEDSPNYFDLEDPASLARLDEPLTALAPLQGLVVIDEVQRRPELFPVLRVLVDRSSSKSHFLILGSASGDLLRQTSESLAGRIEQVSISGFTLDEVGANAEQTLWMRGGFPRSYLATSESDSTSWRRNFTQTLVERDLPAWGVRVPSATLQRFWMLLVHYHGQIWNSAEPARTLALSEPTVRRYLDLLTDAFMIRQLQAYHVNVKKRQVKAPKIFVRDSGLFHQLLGIQSFDSLSLHPKLGASWEGFVLEQILMTQPHDQAYYWATHQGAEIDLILQRGDKLYGIECKRKDAPRITPSIRVAQEDLGLSKVIIVYPGEKRFSLADTTEVVPVSAIASRESLFAET
jgi:uncharacterized protein